MHTLIIGAGMAGLRAATLLRRAGHTVPVVDKGRRIGGRMATRRVDDAVFDTGVLGFHASSDALRTELLAAQAAGHAAADHLGPAGPGRSTSGMTPRWRGAPTMRALPEALAERAGATGGTGTPVAVLLATTVTALAVRDGRWLVTMDQKGAREDRAADALVVTVPAPQCLALLALMGSADHLASERTLAQLGAVTYAPSLTALCRPVDRTLTALPAAPHVALRTGEAIDGLTLHENRRTGASPAVALTLQASPTFSEQHLDGDRTAAAATMAAQASTLVGTALEVVHVHGWRYAQVTRGIDLPALRDDASGAPLVLAGDLFTAHPGEPAELPLEGVERAFLSGGAAAALLTAEPSGPSRAG